MEVKNEKREVTKKKIKIWLVVLMLLVAMLFAFAGCAPFGGDGDNNDDDNKDDPPAVTTTEALFLHGTDLDKYSAGWEIMLHQHGYSSSDVQRIGFYLESNVPSSLTYNQQLTTTYDSMLTDATKKGLVKVYSNSDCTQLAFASQYKIQAPINSKGLFCYPVSIGSSCDLSILDLDNFYTDNVTNMRGMFSGREKLTSLDLSNFNTSNVTDMSNMFYGCESLTSLNLSNFNTNNVTNMKYMFYSCESLTGLMLDSFDTSNVTNMSGMFADCESLTGLLLGKNFNTNKVTNMSSMFVCTFYKNPSASALFICSNFKINGATATKETLAEKTDFNTNVQLYVS